MRWLVSEMLAATTIRVTVGAMENGDSLSVDAQSSARKGGSSEGGFVASGDTMGGDGFRVRAVTSSVAAA